MSLRATVISSCARRSGAVIGALVIGVGTLLGSCGTDDDGGAAPIEETDTTDAATAAPDAGDLGWVGRVEGTNAFAAVVAGGGRIVAYVCDGDAGIGEWFSGEVDDRGGFALESASGATLKGREDDDMVSGDLDLGEGVSHRFELERAQPGAGLYRVEDAAADRDEVRAGWIVDNDGEQRGSLRIGTVSRSAPSLPGSTLTLDGATYSIVGYSVPTRPSPGTPPGVPIPYPNIATAP